MLSDAKRMIGGETVIKRGDGTIQKIKAPGLGHAVFLAGRYTEHAALQAIGGERIVSVTVSESHSPSPLIPRYPSWRLGSEARARTKTDFLV